MRTGSPDQAPKEPRDKPSEIAESILRAAPIDREPVAVEKSKREGILKEKFGLEGSVSLSHAKISDHEVLWSEGFKSCMAVILRAPSGESMLIHAESGLWHRLDMIWEADEKAQRFVRANPGTQIIIVRREPNYGNQFNFKLGYSLLEKLQVPLLKIVEVEAEWPASGVAYDPIADQIYVDQRGISKLLTFKGFQE